MSLIVIPKSEKIIVISSDTRAVINIKETVEDREHQLVYYYDRARKIYVLPKPPHNFVAFSAHGMEPDGFDVSRLTVEFAELLPDRRLSIKEYAERLSDFLRDKYPRAAGDEQTQGVNFFNVVGYDEDNAAPRHYKFELPGTATVSSGEQNPTIAGDDAVRHAIIFAIASVKGEIARDVLQRLRKKAQTEQLSSHEQEGLSQLSHANPDALPWMTDEDFIELAQRLISCTSKKLAQDDAVQSVGGETDVVVITPDHGIAAIAYGEDKQTLSHSETATHFYSITCCGKQTKFQFDTEKEIRDGYVEFPQTEEFVCPECGYSLRLTRDEFLERRKESARLRE